MYVFRVITSFLVILLMAVTGYFLVNSKDNSASVIGFTAMEIVYLMSLICAWY